MKSYTPPVVGEKPPKVGFFARLNGKVSCLYYEGRDPKENVYALWIEGEGLGGLRCFPCVLDEAGDYLVYETVKSPETMQENAMMIRRWPLFLNQKTLPSVRWKRMCFIRSTRSTATTRSSASMKRPAWKCLPI